jgi:hypothetical protein
MGKILFWFVVVASAVATLVGLLFIFDSAFSNKNDSTNVSSNVNARLGEENTALGKENTELGRQNTELGNEITRLQEQIQELKSSGCVIPTP